MTHTHKAESYFKLSSQPSLWKAYQACRRGKSRQPVMAAYDLDADKHILKLHRELRTKNYRPDPWKLRTIYDPKTRLIAAPTIRDRVLHRALLDEIGPHFERSFMNEHYAWGKNRGPHRAVLHFLKANRDFPYRLCLDIRRYFPSVSHEVLHALFARSIRDVQTLELISDLIAHSGSVYQNSKARQVMDLGKDPLPLNTGMALGSYFSQWCGAFYLNELDHFIKRDLKIKGYLRYMDDFVLFAQDREALIDARQVIGEWLWESRRLRLNKKRWHVTPTTEPCTFLGYRVSQSGVQASRKLRRRFKKKILRSAKQGEKAVERTLIAYRGLLCF